MMRLVDNIKILVLVFIMSAICGVASYAQSDDLEFIFDTASSLVPMPNVFKANIDLGGRGLYADNTWPQELAASEVLDRWQKDIGFNGIYRMQFNLWEVSNLSKDKQAQEKLLANYEKVMRSVSDAGGIILLDIFGTPDGLGKVLDKKSPPIDPKAFKELVKSYVQRFSCEKKFNVWYEVWSAPDLEEFFLGRKQEYFNMYRAVAQAVKELKEETKIFIPVGGPAASWWFQNTEGNTIIRPERSLIYELIKFCSAYNLPLDFISWHAYSTDPKADKEKTLYNKTAAELIREWLTYFNLDKNTKLIVDEWNYDSGSNIVLERNKKSFVAASYIPSRIKNMYQAGIDYQMFFALEDFHDIKEGVTRDVGIFWFDWDSSRYKGGPKAIYNAYRMLSRLGNNFYASLKLEDDFVGQIASKNDDECVLIIFNYIDPYFAKNYLSRGISGFTEADRRGLLELIHSNKLDQVLSKAIDLKTLRLRPKLVVALKKAQELNDKAVKMMSTNRNLKLSIKRPKGEYIYQRFVLDSSCVGECEFKPAEEKEITITDQYQQDLILAPYSVNMIVIKNKPEEQKSAPDENPPSQDNKT